MRDSFLDEPWLREPFECAAQRFVADSEQIVVVLLADDVPLDAVSRTLDQCVGVYAPVLAAWLLATIPAE